MMRSSSYDTSANTAEPLGMTARSHRVTASPRTALVVEGGAMRGIFACGVLEVFLEQNFHPFDMAIGVSAGACILASHLAGHRARSFVVFSKYMTRREFIDGVRFIRGGHWVDFDWLWEATQREIPLDCAKVAASSAKFIVSTTSYATGEPVFLEPGEADIMETLRCSCALPIFYRGAAHVAGNRLLDGGVAAPIPVQEAYRRGARRILVIRSRPAEFVKRPSAFGRVATLAFRSAPAFAHALRSAHVAYQSSVEFITNPPADCEVIHVAPPSKLATGRMTQDTRKLEQDFALGREVGVRAIEAWGALERARSVGLQAQS
jgi:predicted patatin/cPLA2 family phospholipase